MTFQQIIFQHPIGPLAEQNTALRFNPVTYRKNDIKIVIFRITCDQAISLLLNCRKFCDSCKSLQFFRQCVVDMFADGFDITVKKNSHLLTVKPNCLTVQTDIKFHISIWLVNDNFTIVADWHKGCVFHIVSFFDVPEKEHCYSNITSL